MFNFDEKRFFGENVHKPTGHFPPEKPRYTMTEEVEHTARQMRETIERLLRFEERAKSEIDDMLRNVTSDNVIFKSTMREAWATFIQEVKNEVNIFEGNIDSTVALFQKDMESNYATLSEDVQLQIENNLKLYVEKLTAFEEGYLSAFSAFKTTINERIEMYNQNNTQTFIDFQQNLNERLHNYEAELTSVFNDYKTTLNETVNNFKNTWATEIENRLNEQDTEISNAVAYMKTNLETSIQTAIDEAIENNAIEAITTKSYNQFKLEKVSVFDTVEALKTSSVVKGMTVKTNGFYNANDGGHAFYIIKEKTASFVEDYFKISINNTLYAELLVENNEINVRQLGALPHYDLSPYLMAYVEKCQVDNKLKLFIPSGVWCCSPTELYAQKGFHIYGVKGFIMEGYSCNGTIITALNNNQDYVLKIGNVEKSATTDRPTANFTIKDLVMSTGVYNGTTNVSELLHVNTACMVISGATLGFIDCIFQCINGTALHINDSWELYFGITNFRCVSDFYTPVLKFGRSVGTTSSGSNISAIEFQTIMFEDVAGDCIYFEEGCKFDGNKIGHINAELAIEHSFIQGAYLDYNANDEGTHYMSLIKCSNAVGLIIDDINVSMLNRRMFTDVENNKFVYKYLIDIPENGLLQGSIGNICVNMVGKNAKLLRGYKVNPRTELAINSALVWEENLCAVNEESLLDLTEFPTIKSMTNLHRKKEGSYETLKSTAIPFYELAYYLIANNIKTLNTDETCVNPLKVAVKSNHASNRTVAIYVNDATVKPVIRVKGEEGVKYIHIIGTSNGVPWDKKFEFTSTGEWQNVAIDTSLLDDGTKVTIVDTVDNVVNDVGLTFDTIRFIPV